MAPKSPSSAPPKEVSPKAAPPKEAPPKAAPPKSLLTKPLPPAPGAVPVPDLAVKFCGIRFKNPVLAASGTFGYGIEFEDIVTLEKLGGFVTKGLSREPMVGNPPPRLFETAAGMLNSIGLQNIGVKAFLEEKLPKLRSEEHTSELQSPIDIS